MYKKTLHYTPVAYSYLCITLYNPLPRIALLNKLFNNCINKIEIIEIIYVHACMLVFCNMVSSIFRLFAQPIICFLL